MLGLEILTPTLVYIAWPRNIDINIGIHSLLLKYKHPNLSVYSLALKYRHQPWCIYLDLEISTSTLVYTYDLTLKYRHQH